MLYTVIDLKNTRAEIDLKDTRAEIDLLLVILFTLNKYKNRNTTL